MRPTTALLHPLRAARDHLLEPQGRAHCATHRALNSRPETLRSLLGFGTKTLGCAPYSIRSGPRKTIYWNPKDVRTDRV